MNKKWSALLFTLVYLAIFIGSLYLFTQYNMQPAGFHPDEPGKVELVQKDLNRFYHPLLLINTLRAVTFVLKLSSATEIVVAGRWVSAVFAALAVITFMGIAQLLRGRIAALAVGLLLGTCPMLLMNAHYLKEDTALLLGTGIAALSLVFYWQRPSAWRMVILGAGSAMAASGKYAGLLILPCLLPFLIFSPEGLVPAVRRRRLLLFFCGFAVILLLFNIQTVTQSHEFVVGLRQESKHIIRNHKGLEMTPYGLFYWRRLAIDLPVKALVLPCAAFYVFLVLRRRKEWETRAETCLLLWPLLYFAVVGAIPVQLERYLLPVIIWILFMAGMGLQPLLDLIGGTILRHGPAQPYRSVYGGTAALLILGVIAPGRLNQCDEYLEQFHHDSRIELGTWMSQNVPAQAKILADLYSGIHINNMGGNARKKPLQLTILYFAGDMGTVEAIKRAGYDYVVICSLSYDRFLDPAVHPDAEGTFKPLEEDRKVTGMEKQITYLERYTRAKRCYEEISSQLELAWSHQPHPAMGGYTNPEVRVYKVRSSAAP